MKNKTKQPKLKLPHPFSDKPVTTATLKVGADTWKLRLLFDHDADGFYLLLPAEREIILGKQPDADGFFEVMLSAIAISLKNADLLKYATRN